MLGKEEQLKAENESLRQELEKIKWLIWRDHELSFGNIGKFFDYVEEQRQILA